MPRLAPEMVYNDLNGEEVKEILLARFADLLSQVPELKRHLTLPRVRMTLNINLQIMGRTPPTLDLQDDLVVRTRDLPSTALPTSESNFDREIEIEVTVNADTMSGGQPPDQVREEHGLPIHTPTRTPYGIQDTPVRRPEAQVYPTPAPPNPPKPVPDPAPANPPAPGGSRYAAFRTLDNGPLRSRTAPPASPTKNVDRDKPDIGLQTDFKESRR